LDPALGGDVIRLVVATTNPGKLREIRDLLTDLPVTLLGLLELPPVEEPEETGATFAENACLKALYYDAHRLRAEPQAAGGVTFTVAEDSGLVIDALDGEPGVRSARFLRPDASYPERFDEIFRRLAERPHLPRRARFVCAVALVHNGHLIYQTSGTVEGEIARAPSGAGGFGYDPIFYYPPYGSTLADVTQEEKIRIAHRGVAFRNLAAWLRLRRGTSDPECGQIENGER
jgi:XTP/dITP diphosphohydrolase